MAELFEHIDRQLTLVSQRTREATLSAQEQASLTGAQTYYLHAISRLEFPTLTELSRQLNVTKPSATAVVNKLIQEGYLERSQSAEDRRVFTLSLTEQGKRVVEIKRKTFAQFAEGIRQHLSVDEVSQLEALLGKALTSLEPK